MEVSVKEQINPSLNIPMEVYICSFEDCSNIEISAPKSILRTIKEQRRKFSNSEEWLRL